MTPLRPEWWLAHCGLKWEFKARGPHAFDCFGLNVFVYAHDFGRVVDDFGDVYGDPALSGFQEGREAIEARVGRYWHRLSDPAGEGWKRSAPWEEGATVLFRAARDLAHCGIATAKPGVLLHCSEGMGSGMLDLAQPCNSKWRRRFDGCFLPR